MNRKMIFVGAAILMLGFSACSKKSSGVGTTTTTAGNTTSSTTSATTGIEAGTTTSTSTTTTGPLLAGQPGATTTAALGFVAGYHETTVEATGHGFIHAYNPTVDTPGTQIHCPGVAVAVGSTFVCQVDANASSFIDEPLKVDTVTPLKLEFAVITPSNFVCSAHAAWVVQAMAKVAMPCSSAPTTTPGQGQGQGQGGGQ